jgi:hypothetical protein
VVKTYCSPLRIYIEFECLPLRGEQKGVNIHHQGQNFRPQGPRGQSLTPVTNFDHYGRTHIRKARKLGDFGFAADACDVDTKRVEQKKIIASVWRNRKKS